MQDIYKIDVAAFLKTLMISYVTVVAIYMLIAYIIYSLRYNRAKKSLKNYYAALKKLSILYEEEGK